MLLLILNVKMGAIYKIETAVLILIYNFSNVLSCKGQYLIADHLNFNPNDERERERERIVIKIIWKKFVFSHKIFFLKFVSAINNTFFNVKETDFVKRK